MTAELATRSVVGSYIIERELGRGGMGAVYLGVHQLLGKRAAIKVLLPALSQRDDLVQRLWAEARAVTAIRHPSIVDIYDYGVADDGSAFIVMEYLEGESLAARLRARGIIAIPHAVALARQVATALAAAHAVGVVHRDLKPDNIFLVADPEVAGGERATLVDFGVAKLVASEEVTVKTITGALLGTPQYMSPEQCEGAREVDHRSDLYSLGCTLFQMIAGRLPFESAGIGGVIGMHLHVPPPKLRDHAPHASRALEAVVARLLAKSPDERFASGEALVAALGDPEVLEIDAAASAPLPRISVDAFGATAVSVVSAGRPAVPERGTIDPIALTATPVAPTPITSAVSKRSRVMWWLGGLALVTLGAVTTMVVSDRTSSSTVVAGERRAAKRSTGAAVRVPTPAPPTTDEGALTLGEAAASAPDPERLARAEQALAEMKAAIGRKEWVQVAELARQVRLDSDEGDLRYQAAEDELRRVESEATGTTVAKIAELATLGKCQRAAQVADAFVRAWGEKAGAPAVEVAKQCVSTKPQAVLRTPAEIAALFAKKSYRAVVAACIVADPEDAPTRYKCGLAACAVDDKPRARFWLLSIPHAWQNRGLNECLNAFKVDLARSVNLLEL